MFEIQRARLISAAIRAVQEEGCANATVAQITSRARVSRRTFYELFANREECLAAVLDHVVALVEDELAAAGVAGLGWRERVRTGLWVILSFLDREPALARACVVEVLQAGPVVLERREAALARLVAVLDAGRGESERTSTLTPVTAEGLVGAALAIVQMRLLRRRSASLRELFGELTGLMLLPYLGSAGARREQTRPLPKPANGGGRGARGGGGVLAGADPLGGVAMRLTYRTARVLEGVAAHPGACNREVAERAEIVDPGQVSKLLARLERLGLLANDGGGHLKGERNAWTLTPRGERIAHSINLHAHITEEAR